MTVAPHLASRIGVQLATPAVKSRMCVSLVTLGVSLYSCPAAGVGRVSAGEGEGTMESKHRFLGECGIVLAITDLDSSSFVDSSVFDLGWEVPWCRRTGSPHPSIDRGHNGETSEGVEVGFSRLSWAVVPLFCFLFQAVDSWGAV